MGRGSWEWPPWWDHGKIAISGLYWGLKGESPEEATREVPGGMKGVEEGVRLSSRVVLSHGSGRHRHSGGIVIRSPALRVGSGLRFRIKPAF